MLKRILSVFVSVSACAMCCNQLYTDADDIYSDVGGGIWQS